MPLNAALLALHLIGAGLVVGAVFVTLIFVSRNLADQASLKTHLLVRQMGFYGAGLAIVSGVIMTYRYGIPLQGNWLFISKLVLVAADGLIAERVIKAYLDSSLAKSSGSDLRTKLLGWAWLSVVIVIAIIALSAYRDKLRI